MPFDPNLIRGSIDLIVLAALADGSKYGYLILKRVREASADQHILQAGTLYPILHRLEAEASVTARWEDVGERRRKWYSLTARGRRRLRDDARAWQAFAEYINGMLAPVAGTA